MPKKSKVEKRVTPLLLPKKENPEEFWKLEFNAETISAAADDGFTLKKLQDYDLSKLRVLIFMAFQRNHRFEVKKPAKAIGIWSGYKFPDEAGGEHNELINKGISKLLKLYEQELGIIPNEDAVEILIEDED